jgi:HEAT repeat protein
MTQTEVDLQVRAAAALGLCQLGGQEVVVRMLQGTGDPELRLASVIALGRYGRPRDIELLARLMRHGDAWVRAHAAVALVGRGDTRGVDGLIEGLTAGDVAIRLQCLGHLRKLAGRRAPPTFDPMLWRQWWREQDGRWPMD